MKLSKRINYIIFPVISVIFTLAGMVSYVSQKHVVLDALNNKLLYHSTYIADALNAQFIDLDNLIKQLLNSSQLTKYLTPENRPQYSIYTIENQFIRFISNVSINTNKKMAFQIIDMEKKNIFQFNTQNPFAEATVSESLKQLVDATQKQLITDQPSKIDTTRYAIHRLSEQIYRLDVYKIFSPEQSIYENMFSPQSRLYIARLSTRINIRQEYLKPLQNALDLNTQLLITPAVSLYIPQNKLALTYRHTNDKTGTTISGWGQIDIQVSDHYIERLLMPYIIAIVSVVINITVICFFLLKRMIKRQIIHPIETLNAQVQKAIEGNSKALNTIASDDEVSALNNNYVKLFDDLDSLARRDTLTGLANRNVFNSSLLRAIDSSSKYDTLCALYYIDLDNFKYVNDGFGHYVGDRVLVEFSRRLIACLREEDIIVRPSLYSDVARLAGDEFALVLPHIQNIDAISNVGKRLVGICENGINVDGVVHDIHVSVGIAVAPNDATDSDTLMKCADLAVSHVKKTGKNGFHFYSDKIAEELRCHSQIELAISDTLKHDDFYLVFMPIYSTTTGEMTSIECLIRANNELLLNYGPEHYIPIAEASSLIKFIDLWVIKTALSHFQWLLEHTNYQGKIAINFSSWQLKNDDFAPTISALIKSYNVPTERIELEITETCLIPNDSRVLERLSELKDIGLNLSLDDFGTGYTAFSQLQHYPVDSLKIDRSFIQQIGGKQASQQRPLVDIILEIASLYNLTTIAEGIETRKQLQYVAHLGCDQVQGYLLKKPIRWEELIDTLINHDPLSVLSRINQDDQEEDMPE